MAESHKVVLTRQTHRMRKLGKCTGDDLGYYGSSYRSSKSSSLGHDRGSRPSKRSMSSESERLQFGTCLFNILDAKLKPQHNDTVLLLQYCKLSKDKNESVKEWMGCV